MLGEQPVPDDVPMRQVLTTLRVILLAMCAGLVTFGAVVMVLIGSGGQSVNPNVGNTLLAVCGALAAANLAAFPLIRRAVLATAGRSLSEAEAVRAASDSGNDAVQAVAAAAYSNLTIIAAALAESVAFFALIGLLLNGDYRFLAFPIAALIVLLLLLPTRERVEAFSRRLSESQVR